MMVRVIPFVQESLLFSSCIIVPFEGEKPTVGDAAGQSRGFANFIEKRRRSETMIFHYLNETLRMRIA
jgi:hypothetical protein